MAMNVCSLNGRHIEGNDQEADSSYGHQSTLNSYVQQELHESSKTNNPNKSFEDLQGEENLLIQLYLKLLILISLGQSTLDCRFL